MIKGGDELVIDEVWKLPTMTLENGLVSEKWMSGLLGLFHSMKLKGRKQSVKTVGVLVYNV